MTFSLYRERDGAGDSGPMSVAFVRNEDTGEVEKEENAKPRVGVVMRVGTYFARTMQYQDYWTTTMVTEIIEERDDYVKFKTGNSVYEWKVF